MVFPFGFLDPLLFNDLDFLVFIDFLRTTLFI